MISDEETQEGPPSQEQEVDWGKELGYEVRGQMFEYLLPKDPEEINSMVTAAVYKLLSGREVSDREIDKAVRDSPETIPDEETEILARDLFEQVRHKYSESKGYKYEWEEAVEQGKKAAEWVREYIDKGFGFSAYYDYWQLRPIKDGVYVDKSRNESDALLMRFPLSEVAGKRGMPSQLVSRDMKPEKLKEMGTDVMSFLENISKKFGLKYEDVVQGMFNGEQQMSFISALNDSGHTDFDKVRTAIVYSGKEDHPTYTPQEQYEMMSENERQAAQTPRHERLNAKMSMVLNQGSTSARFEVGFWTEGDVWFNPDTMSMEGRVTSSDYDAFFANLYPKSDKNTTDQELLRLRKEAASICDELGFTKPSSFW